MKRRLLSLLFAMALIVATGCSITLGDPPERASGDPTIGRPTPSPSPDVSRLPGRIAVLDASGTLTVFEADGSHPTVIAGSDPDVTLVRQPTWSRDGTRIAWVGLDADGDVRDGDDRGVRRHADPPTPSSPPRRSTCPGIRRPPASCIWVGRRRPTSNSVWWTWRRARPTRSTPAARSTSRGRRRGTSCWCTWGPIGSTGWRSTARSPRSAITRDGSALRSGPRTDARCST